MLWEALFAKENPTLSIRNILSNQAHYFGLIKPNKAKPLVNDYITFTDPIKPNI